jgi:hypothetical protein
MNVCNYTYFCMKITAQVVRQVVTEAGVQRLGSCKHCSPYPQCMGVSTAIYACSVLVDIPVDRERDRVAESKGIGIKNPPIGFPK